MLSNCAFLLLSRVEALLLAPSTNSRPSTLDEDSVVRLDAIDATWIELFDTPVVFGVLVGLMSSEELAGDGIDEETRFLLG